MPGFGVDLPPLQPYITLFASTTLQHNNSCGTTMILWLYLTLQSPAWPPTNLSGCSNWNVHAYMTGHDFTLLSTEIMPFRAVTDLGSAAQTSVEDCQFHPNRISLPLKVRYGQLSVLSLCSGQALRLFNHTS